MVRVTVHDNSPPEITDVEGVTWLKLPLEIELAPDGIWALESGKLSVGSSENAGEPIPLTTKVFIDAEEATRKRRIVVENGEPQNVDLRGKWTISELARPNSQFYIEIELKFKGRASIPFSLLVQNDGDPVLRILAPLRRKYNNHIRIRIIAGLLGVATVIIALWGSQADKAVFSSSILDWLPIDAETRRTFFSVLFGGVVALGGLWVGIFRMKMKELWPRLRGRWLYPEFFMDKDMVSLLHGRVALPLSAILSVITLTFAVWQWPAVLPPFPQGSSENLAYYTESHPDSALTAGSSLLGGDLSRTHIAYRDAIRRGKPYAITDVVRGASGATLRERNVKVIFPDGTEDEFPWDVAQWDTSGVLSGVLTENRKFLRVVQETILGLSNQPTWIQHEEHSPWVLTINIDGDIDSGREVATIQELEEGLDSLFVLHQAARARRAFEWHTQSVVSSLRMHLASLLDPDDHIPSNHFHKVLIDRLRRAGSSGQRDSKPVSHLLAAFALTELYVERGGYISETHYSDVLKKYVAFDSLFQADLKIGHGPKEINDRESVWTYWRLLAMFVMQPHEAGTSSWYDSVHVAIQETASREARFVGHYLHATVLSGRWTHWTGGDGQWQSFFPEVISEELLENLRTSTSTFFTDGQESDFPEMRSYIFRHSESLGGGSKLYMCELCSLSEGECSEWCAE